MCICVYIVVVSVCARTCVHVHAWLCVRRVPSTRNRRDHRKGQTSNTLDHNIPIVTMVIDKAKRRSQGSNFMHTMLRNAPLERIRRLYAVRQQNTRRGNTHLAYQLHTGGGCLGGRRGEGRTGFWMNDSTHFPRVRTRPLVRLSRGPDTPAAPHWSTRAVRGPRQTASADRDSRCCPRGRRR